MLATRAEGSAVRRWRSPRALHFRTTAPSAHKIHPHTVGEGLAPPANPHKLPSAHNLHLQGDNALFSLHKRKKCQKRSVPTCRWIAPPPQLPSKKIPTSPHAQAIGANGVPQRDFRCPQSQIFPHRVRTADPKPHHAHCAPRAVWAQTGLVRGDFRPRTITFRSGATVSLPLTGEVARNARRRGLTALQFPTISRPRTR